MHTIKIEKGEKKKCPVCNAIFAIINDNEILVRNTTLLYFNTIDKQAKAKCKQCKHVIIIDLSESGESIINIE